MLESKWHGMSSVAMEAFKKVGEAFSVLSDADKRTGEPVLK